MILSGCAHTFGDGISTDLIIAGRYKFFIQNKTDLARHVMEDADPDFYQKIRPGHSFIVAGHSFGLGSSREQAPLAVKYAGIVGVIAKSFARIFYRNAINVGLPLIECDTDGIEDGDELELDMERGKLKNLTRGFQRDFKLLPPLMKEILASGGLIAYFKQHRELRFEA